MRSLRWYTDVMTLFLRRTFSFLPFIMMLAPTVASAECFSRNLSLGSSGPEVKKLQQILNLSTVSQVSSSGAGSPGNESDFFGAKTQSAVARFQELYRNDILTPSGLTSGSGYVGLMTRKKLESLCAPTAVSPAVPQAMPTSTATVKKDVYVFYPSAYSAIPGKVINISGDQFSLQSQNTVHFGPYTATSAPQNSSILMVHVPNIPPGRYPLWVENAYGTSNKDAFFIVRDPSVPEPTIESITPSSGKGGTVVEIRGSGFLPAGNELRTGLDLLPNVTSSGGVIRWVAPTTFGGGAGTSSLPVWIYVVNDRGVSNPLVFNLKI